MENEGANGLLFDLDGFVEPKNRKPLMSREEKRAIEAEETREQYYQNLKRKLRLGKSLTAKELDWLDAYQRDLKQAAGEDLPDGFVRTAKEVAAHFGKSIRTIRYWVGKGMPQNPDNYSLRDIEAWAIREGLVMRSAQQPGLPAAQAQGEMGQDTQQDAGGSGVPLGGYDRQYWETQIKKVRAAHDALKLQIAKGDYIRRDEVEREWASRWLEMFRGLDFLENRLPPLLAGRGPAEMRAIIKKEIWVLRDRFVREGRFCPAPDEGVS